ncbi:RAD55 family ATPase [Halorarius halobius]|uniref:RAD55 family ATPase n=1 Tax=Halorarius halobius TaxID=2962671 RepID=UPI0020CCE574|nr:hypothetical protein [Halorarius halobius]
MVPSTRRYSTGLPFLDRCIDGGLPAGSLLAIVAPSHSQSELLLKQLVQTRRTTFVSTYRPPDEVERWAESSSTSIDDFTVTQRDVSALLEEFPESVDPIPAESFVILDRTTSLETESRDSYLAFLDAFKRELDRTESTGILHCPTSTAPPARRDLTLSRADQVWQLELLTLSREIKHRLLVTKSRYSRASREPIDLLLTDRVQIDTSRRIA